MAIQKYWECFKTTLPIILLGIRVRKITYRVLFARPRSTKHTKPSCKNCSIPSLITWELSFTTSKLLYHMAESKSTIHFLLSNKHETKTNGETGMSYSRSQDLYKNNTNRNFVWCYLAYVLWHFLPPPTHTHKQNRSAYHTH